MTLTELEALETEVLTAQQISGVLMVNPQSIRLQAYECPEKLGFPVIVLGKRVLIPRTPFIRFMGGEIKRPTAGTADQDAPNRRGERT